jgi:hypothetical protein
MKYVVAFLYKTLAEKIEFREYRANGNLTSLAGVIDFLPLLSIFIVRLE